MGSKITADGDYSHEIKRYLLLGSLDSILKNRHNHFVEKGPFAFPKKGNAKECSNSWTVVLISYASKVMLKILQPRLQQYVK